MWYSLADNHVGMLLQLASTLVIARLLTPAEIGIFAVAAVFAALAGAFRDFGIAEYLIQTKDLTTARIRAAFATNLMVSWCIAVIMFLASAPVAAFYGEPGVGSVMQIQAWNFVLIPFGAITMAYHRRNLNYRPLFIAGLCSNLVGFFVAIAGVLAGLSYMSMAWSSLAGVVVFVLVALLLRPAELPRWPALAGIGEVFRFGMHAVSIYMLGQVGKSAPEAIIGRVLDMPSVAFFGRANGMIELFRRAILQTVGRVCLPYFSDAARTGQPIRQSYLRATTLLIGIGWPFLLCAGIAAEGLIRLLYGPQWSVAVPLAQVLCAAAIIHLPYALATEAMIAAGRIEKSNQLQWLNQSIIIACLGLIFPFGLMGACWGLLIASALGALLSHLHLQRVIGLESIAILRVTSSAGLVALATATPLAFLAYFSDQDTDFLWFVPLALLVSTLAWGLALNTVKHPVLAEVGRVKTILRNKFPN